MSDNMKEWLDDEAQVDLDKFVELSKCTPIDKQDLIQADRRVSAWIEHGRITDSLKAKMTKALNQIEKTHLSS